MMIRDPALMTMVFSEGRMTFKGISTFVSLDKNNPDASKTPKLVHSHDKKETTPTVNSRSFLETSKKVFQSVHVLKDLQKWLFISLSHSKSVLSCLSYRLSIGRDSLHYLLIGLFLLVLMDR